MCMHHNLTENLCQKDCSVTIDVFSVHFSIIPHRAGRYNCKIVYLCINRYLYYVVY